MENRISGYAAISRYISNIARWRFAQGLGTLLDPFTRKALGLPGIAGWVLPLGMTAGFPAAAEATATLYKQGKISTLEAEKLAGAAHFCSPVLLIVVVGTGFLGVPGLGLLLLIVHWAAGLAAGMTLHFLTPSKQKLQQKNLKLKNKANEHHPGSNLLYEIWKRFVEKTVVASVNY